MVVSISSKNNDHLQKNANNCLNSILCVPFNNTNVRGRKLSDEDIHKLTLTAGKVTLLTFKCLKHESKEMFISPVATKCESVLSKRMGTSVDDGARIKNTHIWVVRA